MVRDVSVITLQSWLNQDLKISEKSLIHENQYSKD